MLATSAIGEPHQIMIVVHASSQFARIDYKTDTIIQQSLRNELGKDVTIITVAHRLQTIMDADRIVSMGSCDFSPAVIDRSFYEMYSSQLVLDAGDIVSRYKI